LNNSKSQRNGWYRLLNSDELKVKEVKFFNYCGRSVVVFRGSNEVVYVLDAYCSHMGANLGIGGKVKNNCIQCPFHGWVFEGETGACVVSAENMTPKIVQQYEYNNDVKQAVRSKSGEYLQKCSEGSVKLKKYHVIERHGSIMVWFDSREAFQDKIEYEPLPFRTSLDFRGESINYVNCHIQEIPENGADMRHFDFLHTQLIRGSNLITFEWTMHSHR
jgi:cholesterol 7-dehydrogenase